MSDIPTWQRIVASMAHLMLPEPFFAQLDKLQLTDDEDEAQVTLHYTIFLSLVFLRPALILAAIAPDGRRGALQAALEQIRHLPSASALRPSSIEGMAGPEGNPRGVARTGALKSMAHSLSGGAPTPFDLCNQNSPPEPTWHINRQEIYQRFLEKGTPMLWEQAKAMAAVLSAWVSSGDAPTADPNELVLQAERQAETDFPAARQMLRQAASLALTGRAWFWNWPEELDEPLSDEIKHLMAAVDLLMANRDEPFGTPEEEWRRWQLTEQAFHQAAPGIEREGKAVFESPEFSQQRPVETGDAEWSELDPLLVQLFAGEHALTEDLLAQFQCLREPAIPELLELLEGEGALADENSGSRWAAINALRVLGHLQAIEAIPAIIAILAEERPWSRLHRQAIVALSEMGPHALPVLLEFLHYSRNLNTRIDVAQAILPLAGQADAGELRQAAFRELIHLHEDTTWPVKRVRVAEILAKFGDAQAIPLLVGDLSAPDLSFRDQQKYLTYLRQLSADFQSYGIEDLPGRQTESEDQAQPLFPLSRVLGPEWFIQFVREIPADLRQQLDSETLAHLFTSTAELTMALRLAQAIILTGPEIGSEVASDLLHELELEELTSADDMLQETIIDDADRQTYEHVLNCAVDELVGRLKGVAVSFSFYASGVLLDEIDPNELIAEAERKLADGNTDAALSTVGQAGALALMGKRLWPLWKDELELPMRLWLEGIERIIEQLQRHDHWPLGPIGTEYTRELAFQQQNEGYVPRLFQEEPLEPPPVEVTATVVPLIDALFRGEHAISRTLLERLRRHREDAIPALVRILADRQLWSMEGEGQGWAPVHAARLLGELRADNAVDDLLAALAYSNPEDMIRDVLLKSLRQIGTLAIPPMIEFLHWSNRTAIQALLAEVLAEIGQGDDRVYKALVEFYQESEWESTRGPAAIALGIFHDPRALPLLREALRDEALDEYDISQVISAVNLLGIDIAQDREVRQAMSRVALAKRQPGAPRIVEDDYGQAHKVHYDMRGRPLCPDCGEPMELENGEWVHVLQSPAKVQAIVRPNDPCPCGSGKKYRYCCLQRAVPVARKEPVR